MRCLREAWRACKSTYLLGVMHLCASSALVSVQIAQTEVKYSMPAHGAQLLLPALKKMTQWVESPAGASYISLSPYLLAGAIKPAEAVWHCDGGCYAVLHLVCIQVGSELCQGRGACRMCCVCLHMCWMTRQQREGLHGHKLTWPTCKDHHHDIMELAS